MDAEADPAVSNTLERRTYDIAASIPLPSHTFTSPQQKRDSDELTSFLAHIAGCCYFVKRHRPWRFPPALRSKMKLSLPAQFNWQDSNCVTIAKDQGTCGSCWAFSSVGAYESKLLINGLSVADLSEQQQVSCNTSMSGCCGGNLGAPQYWEAVLPMNEACTGYPSLTEVCGTTSPCSALPSCPPVLYNIKTYHTVNCDYLDDVKSDLMAFGPAYFRFDAYNDFMTFWNSANPGDVYVKDTSTDFEGGHAILLIGFDDSKGAYLFKNSWGATDGPNGDGTFWMAYTGHEIPLNFAMSNFELDIDSAETSACLLAKETIIFRDRARATCLETKAGTFLELGADGRLNGNCTVDGPSTLRNRAYVDGNITLAAGLTMQHGAGYSGTCTEYTPVDPVSITPKSVSVGTTDITVMNNQSRTLNPGSYRNLTVYDRGKLTLNSGVYNFQSIQMFTNVVLTCVGDVEVNVQGNINFSNDGRMVINPSAEVSFYSNGTDVMFGVQTQFKGELTAPNAKVLACDRSTINGCVQAKRIELGCDVICTE